MIESITDVPGDRQLMSRVREKIVNAALDRFHALGFNACGVQEIVDKAGVPNELVTIPNGGHGAYPDSEKLRERPLG